VTTTFQVFKDRVMGDLLPTFCDDPSRGWGCKGFKEDWRNVTEKDAADFMRALDAGLIEHRGRGRYKAKKSKGCEQFFWSGKKGVLPRPVTLWVEPIITVAALSRLHFEWGWPKELIGTQSRKWEFDVTAYRASDMSNEYIAGEVKKTVAELSQLVEHMQRLSTDRDTDDALKSSREINAFRKLKGLQARRASIFWAVGPGGANYVFRMSYTDGGAVIFTPASEDVLAYSGA
jgi:hypothetical protein